GTLLASGFIAGEAITGILLAALFLAGIQSLTKSFTGLDELPFLANWGGWISLVAFAVLAYCLIQVPLKKKSP
ncbi:MAG: oligopeptide transporter, OPT family, partial [Bryobacteraceae bacterium]